MIFREERRQGVRLEDVFFSKSTNYSWRLRDEWFTTNRNHPIKLTNVPVLGGVIASGKQHILSFGRPDNQFGVLEQVGHVVLIVGGGHR